jgi:hypothetical protein
MCWPSNPAFAAGGFFIGCHTLSIARLAYFIASLPLLFIISLLGAPQESGGHAARLSDLRSQKS